MSVTRIGLSLLLLSLAVPISRTQQAQQAPVPETKADATVCEVAKNPKKWDGRTVRIRGKVEMGFETLTLTDADCNAEIWLQLPPEASTSSRGALSMQQFKTAIGATADEDPLHPCNRMHCMKYDVIASLVGTLRYRPTRCQPSEQNHNESSGCGFGHLGQWSTQFVVKSVSDVSTTPVNQKSTN